LPRFPLFRCSCFFCVRTTGIVSGFGFGFAFVASSFLSLISTSNFALSSAASFHCLVASQLKYNTFRLLQKL
jgi:hypothetical protein